MGIRIKKQENGDLSRQAGAVGWGGGEGGIGFMTDRVKDGDLFCSSLVRVS